MQLDVNIVLELMKEKLEGLSYNEILLKAQIKQMDNEMTELQKQLEELQQKLAQYEQPLEVQESSN